MHEYYFVARINSETFELKADFESNRTRSN
jgi:hypothetical protein